MFSTSVYTMEIPFWVKYTLGAKPQATSLIFIIVFVVVILSVSIWGKLVGMVGIKRCWVWVIGVWIVAALILGLASELVIRSIGAAIAGICLAGIKVCRGMIMANFVDRGLVRMAGLISLNFTFESRQA
jgi:Na+/melibiose symporter-like transporter